MSRPRATVSLTTRDGVYLQSTGLHVQDVDKDIVGPLIPHLILLSSQHLHIATVVTRTWICKTPFGNNRPKFTGFKFNNGLEN